MTTISDSVKINIVRNLVEPSYLDEIQQLIKGKKCFKMTGNVFETMAKVFVAVGTILSFSSGYYNYPSLSFMAGTVSTISLAMIQFSNFSYKESKKQSQELNVLLQKLKLDTMPVLEREAELHARTSSGLSPQPAQPPDQKEMFERYKNIVEELDKENV